jgi:hypothetical protein
MRNKYVVVLSARVHPGEAPSSWIMRGVIEYLTGGHQYMIYLPGFTRVRLLLLDHERGHGVLNRWAPLQVLPARFSLKRVPALGS